MLWLFLQPCLPSQPVRTPLYRNLNSMLIYVPVFRLTSSSHPRSGLIACLAFTIVALSVNNDIYAQDPFHVAWTRSCVIIVGTVSAVIVNWILWPFVARHELRKSLSLMMLHLGIYYRVIVAKYVRIILIPFK